MTNYLILPHYRPTVSSQALWFLKEVGDGNKVRLQFVMVIVWRTVWTLTVSFSLSYITRCHQWDKEERPPDWTFFLWIRSVQFNLLCFIIMNSYKHLLPEGEISNCISKTTRKVKFNADEQPQLGVIHLPSNHHFLTLFSNAPLRPRNVLRIWKCRTKWFCSLS